MDSQRPRYHFLPPKNWMNDPNGLIQWNGTYHLFYQHNPNAAYWGDMHWGHAQSPDLVHWEHLPMALAPDPGGPDEGGCFTGCAVAWNGSPAFVYTGWTPQRETVMLATAAGDDLIAWQKHPANPVIAGAPEGLDQVGFRDPFVWRDGERWRMVIGAGIRGEGGAALLYSSPNLTEWVYDGPLLTGEQMGGEPLLNNSTMWECPNFFPLGDTWVLILSLVEGDPMRPVASLCFTGSFDGERFTPDTAAKLDGGDLACYAPQVFQDERGRRIYLGWAQEARSRDAQVRAGWSGVMTLPRLLEWSDAGHLIQKPIPELETLRGAERRWEGLKLQPGEPLALEGLSGTCLEIQAEIDLRGAGGYGAVGLLARRSAGGEEETEIRYEAGRGALVVDTLRSSVSTDDTGSVDEMKIEPAEDGILRLRVFLDQSIMEVYANDQVVITERIYPRDGSDGILLFAREQPFTVRRISAWTMKPI